MIMENTTPNLTLDAMPTPSLTLDASAPAEEVKKEVEPEILSEASLSPEEQKVVDDFAKQIDLTNFAVALPAFLTIVAMPYTYSIANGIGIGFIAWVVMASATGKARTVHPILWIVAAAFVVFFGIGPISDALS